jgi:hypothetical protein
MHRDIILRILRIFGVNTSDPENGFISLEAYVRLVCFLEIKSFSKEMLIDTWIDIIADNGQVRLPLPAFKIMLLKLCEGHLMNDDLEIITNH